MNKKYNKGFTLIELLVVIAIIGILAGLIIVSLGDATNQAKEAKIKSALDQLRPVAQLHQNKYGNYTSTQNLKVDPKVVNIYAEIVANGGTPLATGLHVTADKWSAYSETPTGNCICVDSAGKVKETTTTTGCATTATACP